MQVAVSLKLLARNLTVLVVFFCIWKLEIGSWLDMKFTSVGSLGKVLYWPCSCCLRRWVRELQSGNGSLFCSKRNRVAFASFEGFC